VSALEESDGADVLVIVDDLATLDWLGFSVLDITRFCRALAAACRKVCAILPRVHSITQSLLQSRQMQHCSSDNTCLRHPTRSRCWTTCSGPCTRCVHTT
jgi:hypothetical protein